jgi:2-polyprenyl-6-methoxyphenol hydroxylase-like FAD-dependent oxidoreductase
MMEPLKIAVAGGSIGGFCAGLAWRGAGFDVQVYQRVSGPMDTRGAGIGRRLGAALLWEP